MQVLKKIYLLAAIVMSFSLVAAGTSQIVLASAQDEVCKGVNLDGSTTCTDGGKVNALLRTVLNVLSWVAGVIAIIMIVIAGIQFVTSGGESEKVKKARQTIIYALVGIVVVALAQVLVRFVIKTAGS